jgi:hypothetical protein
LDRAVPTIAVVLLILRLFTPTDSTAKLATWYAPVVVNTYRAQLLSQLERMPGLHLVIIRYNSKHIPADEWVFNGADIDYSKVVWARDMGAEGNAELIRYFKSRKVWLVEPDKIPPQLSPSGTNVEQAKLQ